MVVAGGALQKKLWKSHNQAKLFENLPARVLKIEDERWGVPSAGALL